MDRCILNVSYYLKNTIIKLMSSKKFKSLLNIYTNSLYVTVPLTTFAAFVTYIDIVVNRKSIQPWINLREESAIYR